MQNGSTQGSPDRRHRAGEANDGAWRCVTPVAVSELKRVDSDFFAEE
jgi:hypothetical protein